MSGSLQGLFDELAADASTGENLEAEAAFIALATAAQGKAEQQYGDTIVAAAEPDWKDVQAQALVLLERSRDLRILGTLAIARLNLMGLRGFAEVLDLMARLLDGHWDSVHPQLDPEDDNDPMMRSNAVFGIADPSRVLRMLREYPLVASLRAGRFSWRDIAVATGVIEPEAGVEKPLESTITAAFQETDAAVLTDLRDALAGSLRSLTSMGAIFDDRAGYGTGPDLTRLEKLLGEMLKMIDRYAPVQGAAVAGEPTAGGVANDAQAGAQAGGVPSGVAAASLTAVHTRADAMRLLDLVCAYYERAEPSSPLPLLLQRAKTSGQQEFSRNSSGYCARRHDAGSYRYRNPAARLILLRLCLFSALSD